MIIPPTKEELLRQGAHALRRGRLILAWSSVALGLNAAVVIWLFRRGEWLLGAMLGTTALYLLYEALRLWRWQQRLQRMHDELTAYKED